MTRRTALRAAVIVLAGLGVFWPALRGGWIWDDGPEIAQNQALRSAAGLAQSWVAPAGPDYFPLKTTVQWIEWHLWGDAPAGYHLASLALHLLSALLFWRLLEKLGVRCAWLGGLLFALHPLTVESVAWIAEQKNTLSLPPLLLALGAYVDFDRGRGRAAYARAVLWFLAALLCKSSVVMLPVVVLLHAWWRRGRISWADLRASAPFFALAVGLGLVTVWFQQHRAIAGTDLGLGGWETRLAGAGLAASFYLYKCLVPFGLLPIYPRWQLQPLSPLLFLPWLGWAALGGWFWAKRRSWGRAALFGTGFFLINLLPVLGLVPMYYQRISWVADHFAYVPILGLLGLAAALAGVLAERCAARPARLRDLAWAGAAVAAGLAWAARGDAALYVNEETFWTHTLQWNPAAWVAHNNLGQVRFRQGRLAEAIAEFEQGLAIDDGDAEAQFNLGLALADTGRVPEAIPRYERALQLNPRLAEAWDCLGNARLAQGGLAEAMRDYRAALALRPDYAEAHANLGVALAGSGRLSEAIGEFARAAMLDPMSAAAEFNLGNALAQAGRPAEAAGHYEAALRLKPDYPGARDRLLQARAAAAAGP